jgi:hypothetical protein
MIERTVVLNRGLSQKLIVHGMADILEIAGGLSRCISSMFFRWAPPGRLNSTDTFDAQSTFPFVPLSAFLASLASQYSIPFQSTLSRFDH